MKSDYANSASSLAPLTIAVADDHDLLRESIARLLRNLGPQVLDFATGQALIDAADYCIIDCMVLDVELGACTGFDVAAHPAVARLGAKLIFMSGSFDPDYPVRAARAGCVAFLHKPFAANTLIHTIEKSVLPAISRRRD